MNSIEERLWSYIDGACTDDERAQIAQMLDSDVELRRQYEELLLLNTQFATLELDEPPMAFTYNVMEQIRTEEARVPLKAKVDKRVIYGVAGFFVLTIIAILVLILSNLHWQAGTATAAVSDIKLPVKLTIHNADGLFAGLWLKYFLFFDIVLALFVADDCLRKRARNTVLEK